MKTSIADIYAIGDAIEVTDFVSGSKTYVPLAGPANKQGRIAADTICGIESTYKQYKDRDAKCLTLPLPLPV